MLDEDLVSGDKPNMAAKKSASGVELKNELNTLWSTYYIDQKSE